MRLFKARCESLPSPCLVQPLSKCNVCPGQPNNAGGSHNVSACPVAAFAIASEAVPAVHAELQEELRVAQAPTPSPRHRGATCISRDNLNDALQLDNYT
eukprot:6209736-Pleurochrysis_carterae.AAC.1